MTKEMIFNCTEHETRIAILANGILSNIYIERDAESGLVGNIYKGKVVRVLPGIQAAFVDIGLDRTAFLYVSDVFSDFSDLEFLVSEEEETAQQETVEYEMRIRREPVNIEDLIMEGQEILVQVAKEPIGTKGARLTTHISLPGRNLVLMPTVGHIGISRRIQNEEERKRLRDTIERLRPEKYGFIARTVSEDKREDEGQRQGLQQVQPDAGEGQADATRKAPAVRPQVAEDATQRSEDASKGQHREQYASDARARTASGPSAARWRRTGATGRRP